MIASVRVETGRELMLEKLNFRHYQPGDEVAIAGVYRASDAAVSAKHRMDVEMLQSILSLPVIDAEQDTFVIERDGQIIAFAYCEFVPHGHCFADAVVHPD